MRKVRLEEIAQATKVNMRCLKALEMDDLASLPGEVFTKSFIRSYAKSIGLDPEEAILQLEDCLQETKNGGGEKKKEGFFLEFRRKPQPIVWVIFGSVLVLILIYLLHGW